jgi:hypothetical protein
MKKPEVKRKKIFVFVINLDEIASKLGVDQKCNTI